MQSYHLEIEGIPEYINILEDAQKQAGRAGWIIADETLPLFASRSILTTEQYLWTNNNWEDQSEDQKTCADWKTSYKRAHAKAFVKAQAAEVSVKFGAANAAERILKNIKVATDKDGNRVGIKSLEGYFDNLAAATTNNKLVLEQLVANKAKLAATNEDLVTIIIKLSNENKDIQRETYRLKKTGCSGATQGKRYPTLCPNCKKEGYHVPDACFGLAKNKDKRPPVWKIWLSSSRSR